MRVLAFTKYGPRAASSRQRLWQFLPYLEREGVEVSVLPLLGDDYVARLAEGRRADPAAIALAYARRLGQLATRRGHDLVWLQYELFPYLPGVVERLAGWGGKPLVVDYDDAIFHMYDDHRSKLARAMLGGKLGTLLRSSASACVCGNAYIRSYAERFCDTCITIPTVVDTDHYLPAPHAGERGPVVVGWIGSPSTWPYVEPLLPRLMPLLERCGAVFRAVGAGPAAARHAGVESLPWSEAGEVAAVQSMDIGIMPIPDTAWARGKCGYKLIQYMACGLPVVASPVGVNCEIVREGDNGFLAMHENEWLRALERLIGDPGLRRRMGESGRARAVADYSLASQQPRLLALLRSLVPAG